MNFIEKLEGRELLAAAVPANINLSQLRQNHAEGAIAIDPTNEKRMFVVSNIERGDGLLTMRSSNGGKSWAKRVISNGRGRERLVPACCDGSASWDAFGNLFVAYMN